ncbi:RNA polymerase sigma factor [Pedobacter nyackensis]|uniref:RNA polymerase sigma-70 factor, ECF subfamily n=1 Tax=Pedobacter nyackensis TaxID=475255 RepID=A0A1W2EL17_9SPHI|nr:RNA polymerase sigma-70 factor [Pedobacter nyackensis]SMD10419.1 RNA polymerase sigma-70 factor, ECF subfamily [Pedobacter nyackensis]
MNMKDYSELTDQMLGQLILRQDKLAYTEIYKRYWSLLYQHARRMLQNDEEAKNVVQDVFLMLWSRAPGLELSGSLASYLYAAVRNKILNIFRKNKIANEHLASLEAFVDQGENITDYQIRERELSQIIEKEIARLPERMQQVFLMKRNENLSYKEIATAMGTTELTVKTQMTNALKVLRKKLGAANFHSAFPFL